MNRIMLNLELLSHCGNPVVASAAILNMDHSADNQVFRFQVGKQVSLGRKISDRRLAEIQEKGQDVLTEVLCAQRTLEDELLDLGRVLKLADEIWVMNPEHELVILQVLFRENCLARPWELEVIRCVRTIAKLARIDLESTSVSQPIGDPYDPLYPCLIKTAWVDEAYHRLRVGC